MVANRKDRDVAKCSFETESGMSCGLPSGHDDEDVTEQTPTAQKPKRVVLDFADSVDWLRSRVLADVEAQQ
jgi:hypothetical protein